MPTEHDPLRDRLLGQLPKPGDVAKYRALITRVSGQNEKRIKRERVLVTAFWIFCAASATAWLWFDPSFDTGLRKPFLACIFFTWGGVEVIKHYINACRVDLLKEIKQLQVQIFELDLSSAEKPRGD